MQACQRHEKKSYKHFMLNSQQRSATQKNIAQTRKANANIFLWCSRAMPTLLNSGVQARLYFNAIFLQSVNGKACGSKAWQSHSILFFVLVDEC
jgi:hypothetical protein